MSVNPAVAPAGATPATMGRRIAARLLDILLNLIAQALSFVLIVQGVDNGDSTVALLGMVPVTAYMLFGLWSIFGRGAMPGQLMLGLRHVDFVTGRKAGGKTFLKYLLQSLTMFFSPIITLASIQPPNRSWFDRTAGVILLRGKGSVAPAPTPVFRVAAPPQGWSEEAASLTQLGAPAAPISQAPQPSGSMISAVPFNAPRADRPATMAPPDLPREVVVVEHGAPVPGAPLPGAPVPDAPASAVTACLVLDTGEQVQLTGTTILGRAPVQREGLSDARLVTVADPSVSANHLAIGTDNGLWVMDLRSTNGSTLQQPGAPVVPLKALSRVPVTRGAVIQVGQRTLRIGP